MEHIVMNTAVAETGIADHPVVAKDRWLTQRKALLELGRAGVLSTSVVLKPGD